MTILAACLIVIGAAVALSAPFLSSALLRRDERLAREAIRADAERMARVQAGRRG